MRKTLPFLSLALLAASGIAHVLGGSPGVADSFQARLTAGGAIGYLMAGPLGGVITPVGAAIVCALLLAICVLIITGTPLTQIGQLVRSESELGEDLAGALGERLGAPGLRVLPVAPREVEDAQPRRARPGVVDYVDHGCPPRLPAGRCARGCP